MGPSFSNRGADDLALSLAQNPDLRALVVVHGMHDLATPYFRTKFVLEQSLVNPEARKRLLFGVYPGGICSICKRPAGPNSPPTFAPFMRGPTDAPACCRARPAAALRRAGGRLRCKT